MKLGIALTALVALGLTAGTLSAEAKAKTANVTLSNFKFVPATITVARGTTVVFTNKDPVDHTVTDPKDHIESGLFGTKKKTWSYTFKKPGKYELTCTPHPFMKGEVVVK